MILRTGDIGVLVAGAGAVAAFAMSAWGGGAADTVVIRAAGKVVETATLARAQAFAVSGPLGTTRVEIVPGRARVAADPSPRQLCVKQGWLSRAGEAALCLPNQVSVEIRGRDPAYDTLGY
jgi:hypothetical protein